MLHYVTVVVLRYPLVLILAASVASPRAVAQSKPVLPHFEVATIKPSKDCVPGARSGGQRATGRLILKCSPLTGLIVGAYVRFAEGRFTTQPRPVPISGGPPWTETDLYDINAEAEGAPTEEMMRGPMLQALLQDRFKLRIHHETRSVPVYSLIQSGPGLKLHPFVEGSCVPVDQSTFPPPPAAPNSCHARGKREGAMQIVDAQAMTVSEFARIFLGGAMDRPVIDNTGISGKYDFHLEYGVDESTPRFIAGGGERTGPSIFTAVQEQLGLKLESTKGPGDALVIDHVERPSAN